MSRTVQLLSALACLALAACGNQQTRPDLPDPAGAVVPTVQVVERIVYVPIDSALTGLEPIAEGPLAVCPQVAAERRAALQRCNAKLQQIQQVQGSKPEAQRP